MGFAQAGAGPLGRGGGKFIRLSGPRVSRVCLCPAACAGGAVLHAPQWQRALQRAQGRGDAGVEGGRPAGLLQVRRAPGGRGARAFCRGRVGRLGLACRLLVVWTWWSVGLALALFIRQPQRCHVASRGHSCLTAATSGCTAFPPFGHPSLVSWPAFRVSHPPRGCAANLMRTTPAAAMTFTTFELVSRFLRDNLD